MSTKNPTGSKEVAQQTTWLRSLRQSPAAFLLGIQTRQLRDYADAPRNEDGSYPGRELVEWWARKTANRVEPAALTIADVERSMQALWLLNRGQCEHTSAAVLGFLDRVERARGSAGALGVMRVWKNAWTQNVASVLHANDGNGGDDQSDYLLGHIVQCAECKIFRWGHHWQKMNPRPELETLASICPKCLECDVGTGQQRRGGTAE